jgi:hypothetical protein
MTVNDLNLGIIVESKKIRPIIRICLQMLLDTIATVLRSFDFYMIVHGNPKMKSKKGIKN